MNKLILVGRSTADPDISYYGNEEDAKMAARLTIAVSRKYKREGEPEADFIQCVAYGKIAKNISDFVKKGYLVSVIGPLRNNNYTKQNGEKVYGYQMQIEEIGFLEKKHDPDENNDYMDIPEGINIPFGGN